ncbi:cysteine hydrolase family protein [Mesorhizobium sp. ORM6]
MAAQGLSYGSLGKHCAHVCVDMQRLFAEPSEWATPWITRVLPRIVDLVERKADQTIFTRFIPAARVGQGSGTWKRYYERWASMTIEAIGPEMVELLSPLPAFCPPAKMIDKNVYSPWPEGRLQTELADRGIDTLVITGGETDVCVLATVLGAIDIGYRVILVTDALCSSSDAAHDALMTVYHQRFAQQVETVEMEVVLSAWD